MNNNKTISYVSKLDELKTLSKIVINNNDEMIDFINDHNSLKQLLLEEYSNNEFIVKAVSELPSLNLSQAIDYKKLLLAIVFFPVLFSKKFTIYEIGDRIKTDILALEKPYENILFILNHKVIKEGAEFFSPEKLAQMMNQTGL